jgi:hypothetical protein
MKKMVWLYNEGVVWPPDVNAVVTERNVLSLMSGTARARMR